MRLQRAHGGGYGERLLCAVFGFSDRHRAPLYWIYNYKRAMFYPFIPTGGTEQRDNERELVVKAQIGAELPSSPNSSAGSPSGASRSIRTAGPATACPPSGHRGLGPRLRSAR